MKWGSKFFLEVGESVVTFDAAGGAPPHRGDAQERS
jgi:hypothetical protein